MAEPASTDKALNYNPDANYDQETLQQREQIEKEILLSQPLVGERADIATLFSEYKQDDIYITKIKDLQKRYCGMRRTRGDGNCFYRAFGFAYLEKLLTDSVEMERFHPLILKSLEELVALGFPKFTVEDFHETVMEIVDEVKKCGLDDLYQIFNDQGRSDYFVVYLRLLVSGHLQKEHEFFMNFIDGERSIKEFCNQEVEPMGRESDHIHVIALTQFLGVGIKVEYMDRGEGGKVTSHVFPEDAEPMVHLLYRPGHYDVLYL